MGTEQSYSDYRHAATGQMSSIRFASYSSTQLLRSDNGLGGGAAAAGCD